MTHSVKKHFLGMQARILSRIPKSMSQSMMLCCQRRTLSQLDPSTQVRCVRSQGHVVGQAAEWFEQECRGDSTCPSQALRRRRILDVGHFAGICHGCHRLPLAHRWSHSDLPGREIREIKTSKIAWSPQIDRTAQTVCENDLPASDVTPKGTGRRP